MIQDPIRALCKEQSTWRLTVIRKQAGKVWSEMAVVEWKYCYLLKAEYKGYKVLIGV